MDELREDYDFDLQYHPFELNPQMPEEGKEAASFFAEKFGGAGRREQIFAQTAAVAHEEGLDFDLQKQAWAPNTLKAHRLIALARSQGKQLPVVHALFKAYFAEGKNLGDAEVLLQLATAQGLEAEQVRQVLAGDAFAEEVGEAQLKWRRLGISSVPSFILQNKYLVQGAQAPEHFVSALRELGSELESQAPGCEDGTCNV